MIIPLLFDCRRYSDGALVRSFAAAGARTGRIGGHCEGIRFSPDGAHIIVAEHYNYRLSMFNVNGEFVKLVGVNYVGNGQKDVDFSVDGLLRVCDYSNSLVSPCFVGCTSY